MKVIYLQYNKIIQKKYYKKLSVFFFLYILLSEFYLYIFTSFKLSNTDNFNIIALELSIALSLLMNISIS